MILLSLKWNFVYANMYMLIEEFDEIFNIKKLNISRFIKIRENLLCNSFCAVVDFEHVERQYDTSDEDFELLGWHLPKLPNIATKCEITVDYY